MGSYGRNLHTHYSNLQTRTIDITNIILFIRTSDVVTHWSRSVDPKMSSPRLSGSDIYSIFGSKH